MKRPQGFLVTVVIPDLAMMAVKPLFPFIDPILFHSKGCCIRTVAAAVCLMFFIAPVAAPQSVSTDAAIRSIQDQQREIKEIQKTFTTLIHANTVAVAVNQHDISDLDKAQDKNDIDIDGLKEVVITMRSFAGGVQETILWAGAIGGAVVALFNFLIGAALRKYNGIRDGQGPPSGGIIRRGH